MSLKPCSQEMVVRFIEENGTLCRMYDLKHDLWLCYQEWTKHHGVRTLTRQGFFATMSSCQFQQYKLDKKYQWVWISDFPVPGAVPTERAICHFESQRKFMVLTSNPQKNKKINYLLSDNSHQLKKSDKVYTLSHTAIEIINRYQPSGIVLDPCAGDGVFSSLITGCLTCEIERGNDFFDFKQSVDWIIGNPPYSILSAWLEHSFRISTNIVYLLPISMIFSSRKRLLMIKEYGGIVEIYAPWSGRVIGFDFGWACGAVYFRKGHGSQINFIV